jgi:hypothetical protein
LLHATDQPGLVLADEVGMGKTYVGESRRRLDAAMERSAVLLEKRRERRGPVR